MAGIGFELKKLYNGKSYFSKIKASLISTLVTIGPTLICICMITFMQTIISYLGANKDERLIFLACIIYIYAISLIVTGGFSLFITRYVSDCVYEKKFGKVFPSFFGVSIISIIICSITWTAVLYNSDTSILLKLMSYSLINILVIIWIQAVYLSMVRDYLTIVLDFMIGIITMTFFTFILRKYINLAVLESVLTAMTLGFFIMAVLFLIKMFRIYGIEKYRFIEYFEFIKKIDSYPQLFLIGFLYYFGMYGHNFVFWIAEGVSIKNTFRNAPFYDVPVFYALLSILPSIAIFVVKVETNLYIKYKNYFSASIHGSIKDINQSRKEMVETLTQELKHMMQMQFLITFAAIALGIKLLPGLGLTMLSLDIYNILVLGSFAFINMYIITLILLYFDDRKGVLKIIAFFSVSCIILTIATVFMGSSYYGYGFFAASLLSLILAIIRMVRFLRDVDYYTFALQPVFAVEKKGIFSGIYGKLESVGREK